jgi:hypothetical protein
MRRLVRWCPDDPAPPTPTRTRPSRSTPASTKTASFTTRRAGRGTRSDASYHVHAR